MQSHKRSLIILVALFAAVCLFFLQRSSLHAASNWGLPNSEAEAWQTNIAEDRLDGTYEAQGALPSPPVRTRRLIISKQKRDNVSWLDEQVPHLDRFLYIADDPTAEHHPPRNKGNEVMSYLSYIIEHYDSLPDISIFMHAHRFSWHNNALLDNDAAQMLERLSNDRVIRAGYMNLRCQWGPGCPHWLRPKSDEQHMSKQEQLQIGKVWRALFPDKAVPELLSQPCCGQFAVTREAIRRQPLERYVAFRGWVLDTELSDYLVGRCFEYLWQYIFTGRHEVCPSQHACYCDGYGICFAGEHAFQAWFEVRYNLKQKKKELEAWSRADHEWTELHNNGTWDRLPTAERPEQPERGRDAVLEREIHQMQEELDIQKVVAIRRGNDPRLRAEESGRDWNEADEL